VSVEAAVFSEMFMVTRLYGVNDMWWLSYNKARIMLAPVYQ
jgi:hypothetical protein